MLQNINSEVYFLAWTQSPHETNEFKYDHCLRLRFNECDRHDHARARIRDVWTLNYEMDAFTKWAMDMFRRFGINNSTYQFVMPKCIAYGYETFVDFLHCSMHYITFNIAVSACHYCWMYTVK